MAWRVAVVVATANTAQRYFVVVTCGQVLGVFLYLAPYHLISTNNIFF